MKSVTSTEVFTVDNALLTELGEKLVTTPQVALAELVKNAYDADATQVHLTISEDSNGSPIVTISDNGHGMTRDELRDYWMRIGTSHKADTDKHSFYYGRPVTGAKGIGRFAVRRLGSKVKVRTCAYSPSRKGDPSPYETSSLEINWEDFRPGEKIGKVTVDVTESRSSEDESGLTLEISGAKATDWRLLEDKRSYGYLLRQLAMLVANRGIDRGGDYDPDPGFQIHLHAPRLENDPTAKYLADVLGEDNQVIDLRDRLYSAGWAELTATIDSKGRATCELKAKAPINKRTFRSSHRFTHLSDVRLRIGIFPDKKEWLRDTSIVALGQLNEILSNWGGVQVRYHGARVYPYGDDDWLSIDADRARRLGKPRSEDVVDFAKANRTSLRINPQRVLLNLLSHRSFLGSVEIGEDQKGLEPKADREGFVESPTFLELKEFVRLAIDWSTIWREHAVRLKEHEQTQKEAKRFEALTSVEAGKSNPGAAALGYLSSSLASAKKSNKSIPVKQLDSLRSATKLASSDYKRISEDLRRFQLVASTATLTLLFAHEVKHLLLPLRALRQSLLRNLSQLPPALAKKSEALVEDLSDSVKNLEGLLELTDEMGLVDSSPQPLRLDLRSIVDECCQRFRRVIDIYAIELDKEGVAPGLLVGPIAKAELSSVLLNILSNAIKAVIAGGAKTPIVQFEAHRSNGRVFLNVNDNGIGLKESDREPSFVPLLADPSGSLYSKLKRRLAKEDQQLLGGGSGLGLSIARALLESNRGSIEFIKPQSGWKTSIQIALPCPQ